MSLELNIDPTPTFDVSARLYMQFMEPLGTTDSSVEAAWDFLSQSWRTEFLEVVRELNPGCIRWGGIYSSFWKWREGVGPRDRRVPAHNYLWGGVETNQIGVHEILDLCQAVHAEPLICVNFAADGRPEYIMTAAGEQRAGDPTEAADLVSYCNDPENTERHANGTAEPWRVKLWQLGNETSYPHPDKRFSRQENVQHYLTFAEAMRARDPEIELIGWGDQESGSDHWWASDLIEAAEGQLEYVAIHMMNQRTHDPDTLLFGRRYMQDRELAWQQLQALYQKVATKLETCIEVIQATGSSTKIAITEGHLSLRPHNVNQLLHEWLAGLYYARLMTLFERHGDMVKISTLADFFGMRWTVNAVMLGGPKQPIFLMPAGVIMKLFRQYSGDKGLDVRSPTKDLDVSASRTEDEIFLHVVNTNLHHAQSVNLQLTDHPIQTARVLEIAPGDLGAYVDHEHTDTFTPIEHTLEAASTVAWTFPAASVSIVILKTT